MKHTIKINNLDVEFTDEVPTKPGAYWCMERGRSEPELVRVTHKGATLVGAISGAMTDTPLSNVSGLWSAPLVPVTEVKKAWEEARRDDPNDDECWDVGYNESRAKRVVEGGE